MKIFNLEKKKVLLIVINKEYPDNQPSLLENNLFINHDIFTFKSIPDYLKDIENTKFTKKLFIIEAGKSYKKNRFFLILLIFQFWSKTTKIHIVFLCY